MRLPGVWRATINEYIFQKLGDYALLATSERVPQSVDPLQGWLDFANVGISSLLLLATMLGSLAAIASLRAARKNNQTAKLAILTELADDWSRHLPHWKLAQAIVRGVDDYYAPSLKREKDLVIQAHRSYQRNFASENPALNTIRTDIEALVQYFDRLSVKILEGVLSPADVYSILGPDVVRHSRVIRWTVGAATVRLHLELRSKREPDYGWTDYPISTELRGRRSRIIYLSDALWAELVRMRDLEPHQLWAAAKHKHESKSGREAQKRAFELAKTFSGLNQARTLSHQLTLAEFLPESIFRDFGMRSGAIEDELAVESLREARLYRQIRTWWRRLLLLRFRILAP